MSLVNDALKRAREAQQQAAPRPVPQMQFRPVEPAQEGQQKPGLILPASLAVVALLALVLIWQWVSGPRAAVPQEVRALTRPVPHAKAAAQPALASATTATPIPAAQAETSPPAQLESFPIAPAESAGTAAASDANLPGPLTVAKAQESEAGDTAAITPPPQPKAPPLKLQAIVFNPKRPSALISGKTVFVGDKLGDARVVAIDQESASLVSAGKTNVLSLPE